MNIVYEQILKDKPISAVLCHSSTKHCTVEYSDKGFGCGYRNCQMIFSSLLAKPNYRIHLKRQGIDSVPSVKHIQEMIESAWLMGFDTMGAQQLDNKLINTRKWIGATEIMALLSSMGIPTTLYDFYDTFSDSLILDFVEFQYEGLNHSGILKTNHFPLFLQHDGHSRLIVGIEKSKTGSRHLRLLDPSPSKKNTKCTDLHKHKQYQIIKIEALEKSFLINSELKSTRIPPLPFKMDSLKENVMIIE